MIAGEAIRDDEHGSLAGEGNKETLGESRSCQKLSYDFDKF